jgi:hypothetical protein
MRGAAGRYGWNYIGGVAQGSLDHGYCAPDGDRWINTFADSMNLRDNYHATMSPNADDYTFTANLIDCKLESDLYPGGVERSH